MSILNAIANPKIADVRGEFEKGRQIGEQKLTKDLSGKILAETLGSKIGMQAYQDLQRLNPEVALNLRKALRTESDAVGQYFLGIAKGAASIVRDTQDPMDVARYLGTQMMIAQQSNEPEIAQRLADTIPLLKDPNTAQGVMQDILATDSAFGGKPPVDTNGNEIRKEVRKNLTDSIKQLSREEGVIKTNYSKVRGLSQEILTGNRTSVAQALVSIVKLGDPGSTVRTEEMKDALNTKTPLAALTTLLTDGGVSKDIQDAVLRNIDPLNPDTVNISDILATADQLVMAAVPSIQARYSDATSLGRENLTNQGYNSVFSKGLKERINNLSTLVKPSGGGGDSVTKPINVMTPEELEAERATLLKGVGGQS